MTIDNISAAIQAGRHLGEVRAIPTGTDSITGTASRFHTVLRPQDSELEIIDTVELEQAFAEHPHRKRGVVHVQDAPSFLTYLDNHGLDAETQVYADLARRTLVAVINDHQTSNVSPDGEIITDVSTTAAGHRDHRVQLELLHTDEWKTWLGKDKTWLTQQDFGEFLEDNAVNVIVPDPATMLEIAATLLGSTSVDWKAAHRISNGQSQIRYEETVQARAGEAGDLEIPTTFTVALRPFVGAGPVEITARFRYRINGGNLALSYALLNPDLILEQAFRDQVEHVQESTVHSVYYGRPE